MFERIINFIRSIYPGRDVVPLHEPRFVGKEKEYVNNAIDSTFVSSVGEYVNRFEDMICQISGSKFAIATVNGTSALHVALKLAGVKSGDEVMTQPLSFVATANAISYCGARPIFLDVDRKTLGLSPDALEHFLVHQCRMRDNHCFNIETGRRISACVPMHTFGHPCRIDLIAEICQKHRIPLVEDAAESLGSKYKQQHTGTFGRCGIFSLNGNKTVTCGGGGVIVTDDRNLVARVKHITTTAKIPHPYEYDHDAIGYNYRLPNINAALACAQLELLEYFIQQKRKLAHRYAEFFLSEKIPFLAEPENARSNYWLNAIILPDRKIRDTFLKEANAEGVQARPVWKLLNKLDIYSDCQVDSLENAEWLTDRVVNIPSSVIE